MDSEDTEDILAFIHDNDDAATEDQSESGLEDENAEEDFACEDGGTKAERLQASLARRRRSNTQRSSIVATMGESFMSRSSIGIQLESWAESFSRASMFLGDAGAVVASTLPLDAAPFASDECHQVPDLEDGAAYDGHAGPPIIEVTAPFSVLPPALSDSGETTIEGDFMPAGMTYGSMEDLRNGKSEIAPQQEIESMGPQPMSTFGQTCFNSVNLLMGIGILSLPFAFRITGWIVGGTLLAICCLLTHHTAGLLALCLDYTPAKGNRGSLQPLLSSFPSVTRRAMTYGDIGELAFGNRGRNLISLVFCLELFASSVALVILISDSVTALIPTLPHALVKTVAVLLIAPSTWPTSLKWASYGSLIGIVALVNLISIICYDGFTTYEAPGSLLVPAETHIWPIEWFQVPRAIGLVMAGFCGHSVFPSIYRDMKPTRSNSSEEKETTKREYSKMLNVSYSITTFVYVTIAVTGYLMFGNVTMPEITQNLPTIPSYNKVLTHMTLALTALNPVTKFPLCLNPINVQLEHTLNSVAPTLLSLPMAFGPRAILRTVSAAAVLLVAIVFPTFHAIMGLLGSLFAFTVCVVFPSLCYLKLYGADLGKGQWVYEVGVLISGIVLGTLGTVWSVMP
ncbi:hypothetical protein HKX48_006722 [Thoreauomyces humboldtii]|nr:hypothetical protein HKX48_006722 [Thoreauomyces humboldtii]